MFTYILMIGQNPEDVKRAGAAQELFMKGYGPKRAGTFPKEGHIEGIVFKTEEEVSQFHEEILGLIQVPPEFLKDFEFSQVA